MRIFLTGMAGFIGYHTAAHLAEKGHEIWGLDNLNDYYEPTLKKARLKELEKRKNIHFLQDDLENLEALRKVFSDFRPQAVIHLAAQAGVRYSLENPQAYFQSNLVGFGNVLELCREHQIKHLIYASSSSVYGLSSKLPFSVKDQVDHPASLYAATKKSNELMAHVYSHLYAIRTTGLRFFTVYGPWGRPDMAYYKFTQAILKGKPIQVYNYGDMRRDFTYINDVVSGIEAALRVSQSATDLPLAQIYNLGNNKPENLMDFIHCLEDLLGKKAQIELLPLQPGDVVETAADITESERDLGFRPATSMRVGLADFVSWYKMYYGV